MADDSTLRPTGPRGASRWRSDLCVVLVAALACYVVSLALNLNESLVEALAHYERWHGGAESVPAPRGLAAPPAAGEPGCARSRRGAAGAVRILGRARWRGLRVPFRDDRRDAAGAHQHRRLPRRARSADERDAART